MLDNTENFYHEILSMTIKNWQPPSKQEIRELLDQHQLTVKKSAHMARIGDKTFKEWLDPNNPKLPSQSAWTIFMYEIRAMKMGYQNMEHLFQSIEQQYE